MQWCSILRLQKNLQSYYATIPLFYRNFFSDCSMKSFYWLVFRESLEIPLMIPPPICQKFFQFIFSFILFFIIFYRKSLSASTLLPPVISTVIKLNNILEATPEFLPHVFDKFFLRFPQLISIGDFPKNHVSVFARKSLEYYLSRELISFVFFIIKIFQEFFKHSKSCRSSTRLTLELKQFLPDVRLRFVTRNTSQFCTQFFHFASLPLIILEKKIIDVFIKNLKTILGNLLKRNL